MIPVYGPGKELKKLLYRMQQQTLLPKRMILMHTEDGLDLSWAKEAGIKIPVTEILLQPEQFDHGGTRDWAMKESSSEVVIFMTQDAVPMDRRLVEKLVDALVQEDEIAVSYARQVAGKDSDLLERYIRRFNYPEESRVKSKENIETLGIKTYFCSNVCAAYKREVYEKLGGFETHIIFNEDMVFAAKAITAGYKIAYQAEAVVAHTHTYTHVQQLKRNFDLGVSQAAYPEIFEHISSEKEGGRLLKETTGYLLKKKKPLMVGRLITLSACKYIGYRLGKMHGKLPRCWIKRLTMNPRYWEKEK